MSDYDFSTLSPLDFEKLACDLMNVYFNYEIGQFQTFKAGRDKGIDLLFSTPKNDYEIIAQVKHYVKSPYSKFIYDLKNIEKDKVFQLKPNTYLIITSLELSHQNKSEIKKIFEPYITSLDYIFGREDLNKLIRNNKTVEEKHYKLWFSSSIILNKLLSYKFKGRRNEFTNNVLKKKFRLFVITNDFFKAKLSLQKNRFIILTGEPGVGKSTLSDMIIYDFIKQDYQLNIIYDDIKEIEINLLDDDSKQLFYFDDFLGHTQEEINKSKSAENALIRITSRIENLENKFLILNTRKFILTSFLEDSERFRKFNPLRSETKIELVSYSYSTKRRMLENHILESNLNENQIKTIKSLAHQICSHQNFTPRLIEFFTDSEVLKLNLDDYESFILNNLKNPKEIWNHAYSYQITDYDRFFLNTLFSLKGEDTIQRLEKAYNNRLDFEVKNNNYKKPLNSFEQSLRRLNDGFIIISDEDKYQPKYVSFINHSLEDFLKYFIGNNAQEVDRILMGSTFIKQWYFFFKPYLNDKSSFNKNILDYFKNNYTKFIYQSNPDQSLYEISIFIYYFLETKESNFIFELLNEINIWNFLDGDLEIHFFSKKFLSNVKSYKELNHLISNFASNFFIKSLLNEKNLEDLLELSLIFIKHYDIKLSQLLSQKDDNSIGLQKHIMEVFVNEVEENYKFLKYENTEIDTHIDLIERINKSHNFIVENLLEEFEFNYFFLLNQEWNHIAQNNLVENLTANKGNNENGDDYQFHNLFDDYHFNNLFDDYKYNEYDDNEDVTLDDLITRNNSKLANRYVTNDDITNNDDDFFDDEDELPF